MFDAVTCNVLHTGIGFVNPDIRHPDLSANFIAAENPNILKLKSGFFGCMKIVKNHACEFVMVR